jgi:hypothetical protein
MVIQDAELTLGATYGLQHTAALGGTVVTADAAAQPIRRAVVTLTGATLPTNVSAITDDAGRFMFTALAPGRYTLSASKPAFVTTAYGANRPGRPGTPIRIAEGQQLTDLTVRLTRGAVITGMVRDQFGDPIPGMFVSVHRADLVAGMSGYSTRLENLTTDDRGYFRAYGLAPGEYVVVATPRTSGLGDMRPAPADVDKVLAALRQMGAGRFGKPPASPAKPSTASPSPTSTEPVNYAPIFYPGTPVPSEATRVRVNAGEVHDAIDLTMNLVPSTTVEGVVVSAGGVTMSSALITVTPFGPPLPVFRAVGGSRPAADGRFKLTGVTPGRYTLLVRGSPGTPSPPPAAPVGRGSGVSTTAPLWAQYWAMVDLNVTGTPIAGLTLTLRPPMEFSGRIRFESSSTKPPGDLTTIRLGLTRPDIPGSSAGVTMLNGVPTGAVTPPPMTTAAADGTFTLKGILPGNYVLTATMPAPTGISAWWLKSATVGTRELLDSGVEFGLDGENVTEAVLTFSDARSELSGMLQAVSGQPASDYYVVVFSADRSHWRAGARRVTSTRPSNDGGWSVRGLPAGEYLIAALTDVEPGEWQRPEFLAELVAASVKVRLDEGASVRQDLRIAK